MYLLRPSDGGGDASQRSYFSIVTRRCRATHPDLAWRQYTIPVINGGVQRRTGWHNACRARALFCCWMSHGTAIMWRSRSTIFYFPTTTHPGFVPGGRRRRRHRARLPRFVRVRADASPSRATTMLATGARVCVWWICMSVGAGAFRHLPARRRPSAGVRLECRRRCCLRRLSASQLSAHRTRTRVARFAGVVVIVTYVAVRTGAVALAVSLAPRRRIQHVCALCNVAALFNRNHSPALSSPDVAVLFWIRRLSAGSTGW